MVQTLPSSFLFPIIIYHCENYQLYVNNVPRKSKNKSKKRLGKAHIKKSSQNLPPQCCKMDIIVVRDIL